MESSPGLQSLSLEDVQPQAVQPMGLKTTLSEMSKESTVLAGASPSIRSSKGECWVFNIGRVGKVVSASSARDCSHLETSFPKSLFQGYSAPFVSSTCSHTFTRIERFCKY